MQEKYNYLDDWSNEDIRRALERMDRKGLVVRIGQDRQGLLRGEPYSELIPAELVGKATDHTIKVLDRSEVASVYYSRI